MDFFKYFKHKDAEKTAEELKTPTTTYTQTQPATEPKKIAPKQRTMRQLKVENGYGMLTPTGNYMSPHDIKCLELMGCDLEVLASLRMGDIPDCAPHGNGPHQLSAEYAELKAKEREENAKNAKKAIEALNEDLSTTACAVAATA